MNGQTMTEIEERAWVHLATTGQLRQWWGKPDYAIRLRELGRSLAREAQA
jgi:hypothetical protein